MSSIIPPRALIPLMLCEAKHCLRTAIGEIEKFSGKKIDGMERPDSALVRIRQQKTAM